MSMSLGKRILVITTMNANFRGRTNFKTAHPQVYIRRRILHMRLKLNFGTIQIVVVSTGI